MSEITYETTGQTFGEGDTFLVQNILPENIAASAFDDLQKEVGWNVMHHRGKLPSFYVKMTMK